MEPDSLGGEPFAAPRAAALEDRATRSGGHPHTEAVLPLASTHIGLVGPLHESGKRNRALFRATAGQYRQAPLLPVVHRLGPNRNHPRCGETTVLKHLLQTAVHRCGERCG